MTISFQITYDGDSDLGNLMDVHALAPALLGFGNLIRESNTTLNGERATVKLLVRSDFENKCFSIDFQLVQSLAEQARTLFGTPVVATAKKLLEWLGILATPVGLGILGYLKWKNGRSIKNVTNIEDSTEAGMVRVEVGEGAKVGSVVVHQHVHKLAESYGVKNAITQVIAPIEEGDYQRLEFHPSGEEPRVITRSDAEQIRKSCESEEDEAIEDLEPSSSVVLLRPVRGLALGHRYGFRVRAVNALGAAEPSELMQTAVSSVTVASVIVTPNGQRIPLKGTSKNSSFSGVVDLESG